MLRPQTAISGSSKFTHIVLIALQIVGVGIVPVYAASPWEDAVNALQISFTGPIAKGLSLVAIVVGGLMFAFGEGDSKRMLAGILFGVGMAISAVNFMTWLFPKSAPLAKEPFMTTKPDVHRVYKSINKPLTIFGIERSMFFLSAVIGAATFNFIGSLLSGISMFVALYLFGRWATIKEPNLLRILLNSSKFKVRYDPIKSAPDIRVCRHA